MYAIVETGGKQYKVAEGDTILIERLSGAPQEAFELEKVLLVHDGKKVHIGTPYLPKAKVLCKFLDEVRAKKVVKFQYRRRKGYSRKVGHRQDLFRLKVEKLSF